MSEFVGKQFGIKSRPTVFTTDNIFKTTPTTTFSRFNWLRGTVMKNLLKVIKVV